jgi:DNA-damage-inducible protein D
MVRHGGKNIVKSELVRTLTENFEAHARHTESGIEFWLARDIQYLLGYSKWENFLNVVSKARTACEISGHAVENHFPDVRKMVDLGSGSQREVDDIMLTRYACYLIAQNGDPRKPEIAFAQTYFALQTRRAELIEQRIMEAERVQARHKLATTEKELSQVIYEQTGGNQDFALIRSKGDHALFNKTTQQMKTQWNVPESRPLADFAPTIILREDERQVKTLCYPRNPDLDPQLVWRGKDEHDLLVKSPPLYIQEKIHPKALIDDLKRMSAPMTKAKPRLTSSLTSTVCPKASTKPSFTPTTSTGRTA